MTSKFGIKTVAFATALVLLGAGCLGPGTDSELAPSVEEPVKSGESVSEQSDIIVDELLDDLLEDDEDLGEVDDDAALYSSDDLEFNNLGNSYDESEL